jgi:hypothetical protein
LNVSRERSADLLRSLSSENCKTHGGAISLESQNQKWLCARQCCWKAGHWPTRSEYDLDGASILAGGTTIQSASDAMQARHSLTVFTNRIASSMS